MRSTSPYFVTVTSLVGTGSVVATAVVADGVVDSVVGYVVVGSVGITTGSEAPTIALRVDLSSLSTIF